MIPHKPFKSTFAPGAKRLLGLFALLVLGAQLTAQTYRTWDDGHSSDDWSQRNNWSNNNKPGGNSEVARFSNGNAGSTSIDINSNQRTGGMLFDANLTVDITFLRASSELSIRNGGANYGITNNSDQTITFENQMGIENDMTWKSTNVSGGSLIFEEEVDTDGNDLTLEATNTANLISISGNVIDSGGLIKTGNGKLVLSGTNTYTGDTTISNGTLEAQSNSALGDSGNTTTVSSGGTLALSGGINVTQDTFDFSGTGESSAGAVQNISGNNTLTGEFELNANTTVTSDAGTLTFGTDPGYNNFATQLFTNNGFDLTFDGSGDSVLYAGLSGSGDLIKTGAGTLTIEGTPNPSSVTTFTGETFVNEGELVLATLFNDAPGVGPLEDFFIYNNITVGDGTGAAGTATLTFGTNEAGGINDYGNILDSGVSITVNADGAVDTQGHTQYVQDITMDGGSINADNSGGTGNNLFVVGDIFSTNTSQTASIDGKLDFNADGTKTIDVSSGSTLDINARIQNGGFDKQGDGTLILSGGNTFTGQADISDGVVRIDNNLALGATSGSTNVDSGAQLQLDGVSIGAEALTLNGSGPSSNGALQTITGTTNSWAGNITVASASEIEVTAASSLTLTGIIAGSGQTLTVDSAGTASITGSTTLNTLNKTGSGSLTLSGSPKTISTTNVSDGTLTLGSSDILNDSMDLNVSGNGTFAMAGGITETIDQLNVSGGALDVDGILTMNGGTISGGTGIDSTGELILTAGNTLNITNDFDFGGTLELTAGTTLALAGGGTTVDIDTLKITGNSVIDFGAGVATTLNLGALEISGTTTAITVNNWVSFQDLWTTSSFTGGFGGVTIDQRDNNTAQITFNGFTPSDTIWLTFDFGANEITVPEPSSYGAILMALGLGMWLTRRPRRKATALI